MPSKAWRARINEQADPGFSLEPVFSLALAVLGLRTSCGFRQLIRLGANAPRKPAPRAK
jgi:hypothetical protein